MSKQSDNIDKIQSRLSHCDLSVLAERLDDDFEFGFFIVSHYKAVKMQAIKHTIRLKSLIDEFKACEENQDSYVSGVNYRKLINQYLRRLEKLNRILVDIASDHNNSEVS
jgi:hypothetical protein